MLDHFKQLIVYCQMKLPIYLDYAATTPVDKRVAEKMMQFLTSDGEFGNPTSFSHVFGQAAKRAVDEAREQVADLIHAEPTEIVWTSGATEAINLALKGAATLYQRKGKHIVTLKTEHKAVLDTCQQLEKEGYAVTYLTPAPNGLLDIQQLQAALRNDTILVSILHVNNEIGVIQDLQAIANLTAAKGILLHVDAAQSAGKLPIDVSSVPVDLMSFCAHKIYGPKGIGALYLRRKPRVRVAAQIHGGGQEQGMRSGTLPTHQIVGMGEACALAKIAMQADYNKLVMLRESLWQGLSALKNVSLNGELAHCFPGIINIGFQGMLSQDFMQIFPELAVSAGSACHAKGIEPSYVLRALGLTTESAQEAIRFSLGRFTAQAEIDFAVEKIAAKMNLNK
jgi:cysteine desulfurase